MTTYFPPKKNTAYVIYISLISQANTKIMQSSPTIAAGDFKVSIDGGALANLATLPVVTPAASKMIKVDLSASEMNGDNITLVCSDAAGAEWCDLVLNLQTTARQIDDLATPTNITAGTITTVTNLTNAPTNGDLTATMKTSVTTAATAATPTAAAVTGNVGGNVAGSVGSVTGAVGSVTGNVGGNVVGSVASVTAAVTVGTNNDKTGYELSGAGVTAVQSGLATIANQTTINNNVLTRATPAQVNAEVLDVLTVDTFAEVTSAPAATSTLKDKIGWLFKLARNLRKTTSTTDSVYNDAGAVVDSTSTISDDGTTFTRGEYT